MAEQGDPIEQPAIYRTLLVAFGIWAAHFIISYGAALIFPGEPLARWIAVGALIAAIIALAVWTLRLKPAPPHLALAAVALSLAAIVLGTFPAFVG